MKVRKHADYRTLGACLESQGTLGTDKKFTGQRLDQTGLYYYNARYYDPLIGRFISPDTVGQSQMNPQCLNRYSYCLNNPLKYIDPTGHYVSFLLDKYYNETLSVWNKYKELYPDLAAIMETSDEMFTLRGGEIPGCLGSTSISHDASGTDKDGNYYFAGTTITLNYSMIGGASNLGVLNADPYNLTGLRSAGNINPAVCVFAHESVHAIGNTISGGNASIWEETLALQFEYNCGQRLGYYPSWWFEHDMYNSFHDARNAMTVTLTDNFSDSNAMAYAIGAALRNSYYVSTNYQAPDGYTWYPRSSSYGSALFKTIMASIKK